jgi:hypothetical protein
MCTHSALARQLAPAIITRAPRLHAILRKHQFDTSILNKPGMFCADHHWVVNAMDIIDLFYVWLSLRALFVRIQTLKCKNALGALISPLSLWLAALVFHS